MKKIILMTAIAGLLILGGFYLPTNKQTGIAAAKLDSGLIVDADEAHEKHGGGSGLVFVVAVGAIMSFVKLRRAAKVRWAQRQALEELLEGMPGSRQEKFALINQISERFAAVQTGWGQLPEAEMSRHCTPKLTAKHTKLASEIQNEGYTIYTGDLEVSQLRNYRQINQESFSIDFDFSCVAYLMSDNGYVMDGRVTDRQRFIQKLFFDYDPTSDSWKVDFIQEKDVY